MTASHQTETLALIDRLEAEIAERSRLLVELQRGLVWETTPAVGTVGGPIPNPVLRQVRQRRNLTQAELADALVALAARDGVNVACCGKRVARWERGEVRWPSPLYRRLLCTYFGVADASRLGFVFPVTQEPERSRPVVPHIRGGSCSSKYRIGRTVGWLEPGHLMETAEISTRNRKDH